MPSPEPIDAGEAWFRLPVHPPGGRVLAVFRRAVYLQVGDGVVAVVPADIPPGPLHLRVRALPAAPVGDEVHIDFTLAPRWRPPPVDPCAVVAAAPRALALLGLAEHSELARDGTTDAVDVALAAGDLAAVVGRLGGRGRGLTPAGDDALAGIVLVLAAAGWDHEDLVAQVARARTHAISLAFLEWAARGQAVEPVHDLLTAVVRDDWAGVAHHQARVASIGQTSGVDLLLGLRLGLACLSARSGQPDRHMVSNRLT